MLSCWWKAKTHRNVCVGVIRRKSIVVWTQRKLLKTRGLSFYILKIRLQNLQKPFFLAASKNKIFLVWGIVFENKRAEPRHVTMICHCGILLFINAKASINTRKLTYSCCWVCCDKLQLVETKRHYSAMSLFRLFLGSSLFGRLNCLPYAKKLFGFWRIVTASPYWLSF